MVMIVSAAKKTAAALFALSDFACFMVLLFLVCGLTY